jgi:hypothetical protein
MIRRAMSAVHRVLLRPERGSALYLIAILCADGKWWITGFLPGVALGSFHLVKGMRRRQFF